jgi:phage shock protein E
VNVGEGVAKLVLVDCLGGNASVNDLAKEATHSGFSLQEEESIGAPRKKIFLKKRSARTGERSKLETMHWTTICMFVAVFAVILLLKRTGQISSADALAHLKGGALLIDVRTPAEFSAGHLPSAINLPLDQIATPLPRRLKNKSQVLLLHCQSGMRSGAAKKKLTALGYSNVYNLGSYGRAEEIAGGK